jgi:ATP-dependent helicase HrpB
VPAAILDAGLAGDRDVVVLEPRRIAARAAAQFVAEERGGRVGEEVGYRVRFEQRGGPSTRLWFVTEGILGRQLTRDPFLEGVGVVVLDEFHERHLQGDVALAVVRELQETVRPDLKLVVMSATLDVGPLSVYLGDCPVLTAHGREHPVRIDYDTMPDPRPLAARVAGALRRLVQNGDDRGDVLVFLPGAAEIRRAAVAIESIAAEHDVDVVSLYGDLPLDAQQRVMQRGTRRRVVLSTNVAETSLTIEGVTAVIDSGLARMSRFDDRHGINTLRVAPISRASAEQRAGRAGRLAPGRCLRLWTQGEHQGRREREVPEVLRLDLSGVLLELRAWGLQRPEGLRWLDPPPGGAVQRAEHLLDSLTALHDRGLTDTGRRMLALSVPPRLARMLVEAERRGCVEEAALLAALASERDILLERRERTGTAPAAKPRASEDSDLELRAELFEQAKQHGFGSGMCQALGLDRRSVRAVERARRQVFRVLSAEGSGANACDGEAARRCVLAGFADRVVRRRAPGAARGVMVGGTGVVLDESSVVRDAELFVAVELDRGGRGERREARVRVASAVCREWLEELFPDSLRRESDLVFDEDRELVVERVRELYQDLVLKESLRFEVDRRRAGAVLEEAAACDPELAVAAGEAERRLLARIEFLSRNLPELDLPADSSAVLAGAVRSLCRARRSFAELRQADLGAALRRQLTAEQRRALDHEAPAQYQLPTGGTVPVRYERGRPPAFAARIQEVFGLRSTPRLARGRVPLLIELLAPNQRPVQVTDDLENFWRHTYAEVRKQLRGRYPKHAWPEDPTTAQPRRGTGRGAQPVRRKNKR